MATGDIDYLKSNNNDCTIEDSEGVQQRAILAVSPIGAPNAGMPLETLSQDPEYPAIELFLTNKIIDVVIESNMVIDENEFQITPFVQGAIVGDDSYYLEVSYNDPESNIITLYQSEIIEIDSTGSPYLIRTAIPLDFNLDIAKIERCQISDADTARVSSGTSTTNRKEMSIAPPQSALWHLTRIMVSAILDSAGDDGNFCGRTPLIWGLYFGIKNDPLTRAYYLANVKSNADFRISAFDLVYPTRSGGGGDYGLGVRKTFEKYGTIVPVDGNNTERFVVVIQEPFTDIPELKFGVQGHIADR